MWGAVTNIGYDGMPTSLGIVHIYIIFYVHRPSNNTTRDRTADILWSKNRLSGRIYAKMQTKIYYLEEYSTVYAKMQTKILFHVIFISQN